MGLQPLGHHELEDLLNLRSALQSQDNLILNVATRLPYSAVHDAQLVVLESLFRRVAETLPESPITFIKSDDPDAIRPQIHSALSTVEARMRAIERELGQRSNEQSTPQNFPEPDRHRVFVVHGRNTKARDAMFSFLRSIALDPIEWEEAIQMTAEASPYIGNVLDIAFANAQAALIMLTGDDVACLGEQLQEPDDPDHEKRLTAQARPNVLFEMGMAFGKYPMRTVIVEFGRPRPFSDVAGRSTIHFSDAAASRKKIADRLRSAGCLLRTDNRTDWLREGDFSTAFDLPIPPGRTDQLKQLRQIEDLSRDRLINYKKLEVFAKQNEDLEAERRDLQERLNYSHRKHAEVEATLTDLNERLVECRRQYAESEERNARLRLKLGEFESGVSTAEGRKAFQAQKTAELEGDSKEIMEDRRVNHISQISRVPPVRGDHLSIESPEHFVVKFISHETNDTKGFLVTIDNNRLKAIARWRLKVLTGQSFDSDHKAWRESRLNSFQVDSSKSIPAKESGESIWFLRRTKFDPHLLIGTDNLHPLPWPQNDKSLLQRWLVRLEITSQESTNPDHPTPLPAVCAHLIAEWNTSTDDMILLSHIGERLTS